LLYNNPQQIEQVKLELKTTIVYKNKDINEQIGTET